MRTLDVILTNISHFYDSPQKFAPFGLSDHFTIKVHPKSRTPNLNRSKIVKSRNLKPSLKQALGRVLSSLDWSFLNNINSCENKLEIFSDILTKSLDIIIPIKEKKIHVNDAPWMTDKLKTAINNRQRALNSGNRSSFKYYRILLILNGRNVDNPTSMVR